MDYIIHVELGVIIILLLPDFLEKVKIPYRQLKNYLYRRQLHKAAQ